MGLENFKNLVFAPIELKNKSNINLSNNWFKDPKVYAEKILKCPAVTASISMPMQKLAKDGNSVVSQTVTIPFYMQDDFNCGTLQNKWSDVLDMSSLEGWAQWLNGIGGGFTGSANVAIQSELMSLKNWKGSTFDGFNVRCLFLSTRRSIVPPEIITTLAASALPTKLKGDNIVGAGLENIISGLAGFAEQSINNVGGWVQDNVLKLSGDQKDTYEKAVKTTADTAKYALTDVGMVAPLHYGYNLKSENGQKPGPIENTTLTLQVGDWFRATNLIVNSISNITYSKEVIAPASYFSKDDKRGGDLYNNSPDKENEKIDGYPLWGQCNVNLIPCQMVTKDTFESYFLKKSNTSALSEVRSALETGDLKGISNLFELPD